MLAWRFLYLCFLNILLWTLARFDTRTIPMRKFLVTKVCPRWYGRILEEHRWMTDKLWCLNKCWNSTLCKSCTFVAGNSTCLLNAEVIDTTTDMGCEYLVDYAEVTTQDPSREAQFTLCNRNGCTSTRNGYRLCNGGSSGRCDITKGRLEVYHDNQWGTICDDMWNKHNFTNPNVACKMFGFSYGKLLSGSEYGPGTGIIWLDNVACTGREDSLEDCHHTRWGTHNCDHGEDVGISCHGD